eukprot:TRINITY_DN123097_c0_g1_i1.p1 TRINITY_DN123097_c0_g1~~TRINITY_DN123097_c0_g1_i1.p1  ORF type:complete len:503 (+),score=107.78 TRINITY_DN123097_c0_g1_i1:94-1602(+)
MGAQVCLYLRGSGRDTTYKSSITFFPRLSTMFSKAVAQRSVNGLLANTSRRAGPASLSGLRQKSAAATPPRRGHAATQSMTPSAGSVPPFAAFQSVPELKEKKMAPELSSEPITGPSVWTGKELEADPWWGYELTQDDLEDLYQATQVAKKSVEWLHPGVPDIFAKDSFPLGEVMKAKLASLQDAIENGKGLAMIKNMPVTDPRLSEDDLAIMYLGVSVHIGHIILQSSSGLRSVTRGYGLPLGKVQAEMTGETPKQGKQTNNHFRFHTDRCDVISLMSIRTAPTGGASRVCSAPAIYNTLLERDPELARTLTEPIDRIWEGENGFFRLPVMGLTPSGKFTTQISPSYVENAQFLDNTIKATKMQIQALDAIEDLGMELGAEFRMQPGMLYFLNNHQVYHGRGNWTVTDDEREGAWGKQGRLLFRTWISPYNSRELPDDEQTRFLWGNVEAGAPRGGYDQAISTGEVPKPKIPEDHKYYSLYSDETQQRSMWEKCNTVFKYE